jgi:hypothetical protein
MYQIKLKSANPLSGEEHPDVVYAGRVGKDRIASSSN